MTIATEHFQDMERPVGEILSQQRDFWEYWRFEPWSEGPFTGVWRRQRFVKDGILGPVAEYWAWEAIVWAAGEKRDREALWHALRPLPDVMTQRFLFVFDDPWPERRIRSFAWGFKGYGEFFAYWPGHRANPKARDLTGLVDLALRVEEKAATAGGSPA